MPKKKKKSSKREKYDESEKVDCKENKEDDILKSERIFTEWQSPLRDWLGPVTEWQRPMAQWQKPLLDWYVPNDSRVTMTQLAVGPGGEGSSHLSDGQQSPGLEETVLM